MNNVRRITFVLRKKKCIFLLLLLHSVSSSRFDSTQRPAFPIERFKQKPHVHLKVNFISNSSSNFLEVRPNCGNQTDLKIIATLFFFFFFSGLGGSDGGADAGMCLVRNLFSPRDRYHAMHAFSMSSTQSQIVHARMSLGLTGNPI